jgi:copper oxidase (laccase) domain-containing protein
MSCRDNHPGHWEEFNSQTHTHNAVASDHNVQMDKAGYQGRCDLQGVVTICEREHYYSYRSTLTITLNEGICSVLDTRFDYTWVMVF